MHLATEPFPIPVTVITGYLGAGKTTLLNQWLRHPAFANSAVVINEFGEIGLDHLLIETPVENTVLLEGGCLCCEVRGELVDTLSNLYDNARSGKIRRFDRLVIETTGLADPVPILQTLVTDPRLSGIFCLERVVTLVDGLHGGTQLDRHPESAKQIAIADCLVVSKSDLAPAAAASLLMARLRRLNPGAGRWLSAEAVADPLALFGARPARHETSLPAALGWINTAAYDDGDGDGQRLPGPVAGHDHGIASFSFHHEGEIRSDGLVLWLNLLAALKGANLLRLKAILNVEGRPVVIQAVQTIIHEPFTLDRWPDAERRSRIVVIGHRLQRADIERTFSAFRFQTGPMQATGAIDPRAYARFLEVAGQMAPARAREPGVL